MKPHAEEAPEYTPDATCSRCGMTTPMLLSPRLFNNRREHTMPPGWSTVYLLHAAKGILEFCPRCSQIVVALLNEKHPGTAATETP